MLLSGVLLTAPRFASVSLSLTSLVRIEQLGLGSGRPLQNLACGHPLTSLLTCTIIPVRPSVRQTPCQDETAQSPPIRACDRGSVRPPRLKSASSSADLGPCESAGGCPTDAAVGRPRRPPDLEWPRPISPLAPARRVGISSSPSRSGGGRSPEVKPPAGRAGLSERRLESRTRDRKRGPR